MPDDSAPSRVFISYSHNDEFIVNRLRVFLKPLERTSTIDIWDDRGIAPGQQWDDEIRQAILTAKVALLVISPDFLASDYLQQVELPLLLKRVDAGELVVIPIIARPSIWSEVPWLRKFQSWPADGKALTELDGTEQERQIAALAYQVAAVVEAEPRQPVSQRPLVSDAERRNEFFVSHDHTDGDFAELLTLRLEREKLHTWVDLDRIAVGRDWRLEIDQAIRASSAVIVIVTPASRLSEYVTYEWAFALGVGVPVVPILLHETHLHPRLETLQYLDFTNRGVRPWTRLIDHLRSLLK